MYTKYYLVIPCRTLSIADLRMRSLNASRFCRFYVNVIEVLHTSVLPLSGDTCWFSRARIERRLLLCIVTVPWEGEPSTLLYWKIPCVGARMPRHSCSSTTLVLPPSALSTPHSLGERSLGGWYLVRAQRSRLCLRPPAEGRTYIRTWWTSRYETSSMRYETLQHTPPWGQFVRGRDRPRFL